MAKTMTITVDDRTGATEIDLGGFHGVGCDAVMKVMVEGSKVVDTQKKPEYNEKEKLLINARN
jgi:hypothetical protein